MKRYTSRASNGKGFRMVYPNHGRTDGYHWHANVTTRRRPPREWRNRAGNTRWLWLGVAKSFAAYFGLWVRHAR